ncbi:MAG: hypothetical protein ASARMPRED_001004 [Alectoria sarmentosa]|nr:MAG: hypothetical protein ASARMPRED_001004 [Alectoria sarmentosa]
MYPSKPANSRTTSGDKFANQNLEVGDVVDVPGMMHGTIKFIGEVKGKNGHFAGVELSKEFAAKGKNDGDVDGVRYFITTIRGAGIFLPSNKAYKRLSTTFSADSMPLTPPTPSLAPSSRNTPTSSMTSKFSQSVGPGRAPSPVRIKSRPSLPRPESPLRKAQNATSTPSGQPSLGAPKLSKSISGGPRYAPSPTPARFGASVRGGKDGDPGKRAMNTAKSTPKTPNNVRPQSRSESRLGPEAMFDEDSDNTPIGTAKIVYGAQSTRQSSWPVPNQDDEVKQLRLKLQERDRQLEKQTSDLEDMQNSIAELQSVERTPTHNSAGTLRSRGSGIDELDAPSLRALVREKNEKIATLTSDFDAHRAQFRNTIDSLERTSDETNRIYEQQVDSLKQEIRELQDRGEDVESVAQQLKQLEELVQELEEGLEDARRGEAEARGEVEFLRGEVDRTRSELRQEREKAIAALKGASATMDGGLSPGGSSREVEQRDDEIRGLKAIIHSLSRDAVPEMGSPRPGSRRVSKQLHSGLNQVNGHSESQLAEERQARDKLEREVKELEGLVDRKTYREEELEYEIRRLRENAAQVSASSNGYTERPSTSNNHRPNPSKQSSNDWREQASDTERRGGHLESMPEIDSHSTTMTESSTLYCDMCETFGHEILTCPTINGETSDRQSNSKPSPSSQRTGRDNVLEGLRGLGVSPPQTKIYPAPLSPAMTPKASLMPNPMEQGPVAGKKSGVIDGEKWCALCERDGHESVDCPFEDMY